MNIARLTRNVIVPVNDEEQGWSQIDLLAHVLPRVAFLGVTAVLVFNVVLITMKSETLM